MPVPVAHDERGETLVELLVTVAILGVSAVAVLGAMLLGIFSSDVGRKQSTSSAYARSFAEAIQKSVDANGGYASCATATSTYGAVAVPGLPGGYTRSVAAVESWSGSAWGGCDANGIQRITVRVVSTGTGERQATEELVVVLRKPCNGSADAVGADPCAA